MQNLKKLIVLAIPVLINMNNTQAKCKELDSLALKCNLTVCGEINGTSMGELLAYGSFINEVNGTTITLGENIPFTSDTIVPVGMSHGPAPFTSITIEQDGVYSFLYKVHTTDMGNTFVTQIYLNGNPVLGTDDGGVTLTLADVLFIAHAGDVLTLRFTNGTTSTIVLDTISTTPPASLTLMRIA